ncbi:MAG: hypothetical protein AAF291_02060 [Pseudomonadota bacterium]
MSNTTLKLSTILAAIAAVSPLGLTACAEPNDDAAETVMTTDETDIEERSPTAPDDGVVPDSTRFGEPGYEGAEPITGDDLTVQEGIEDDGTELDEVDDIVDEGRSP